MKQPNVTVYGSKSCSDTTRALQYLDAHQIPYEYKDVDISPEYNDYIAGLNGGKRVMPTIRLDNQTLINPGAEELGEAIADAASERA